jgi:hypothetical protein
MVHRTYVGLGAPEACVKIFDDLAPFAEALLDLQWDCPRGGLDHMAMGIAWDGLNTAAHHFTRRRYFYHRLEEAARLKAVGNGRLRDREEAVVAFKALAPHVDRLRALQLRCRPMGRDYLAIAMVRESLESAAFHFTHEDNFYGSRGDSAGPTRPAL